MKTNIIYNEDNVKGLQKHIPNNSIDLTVTSPPYDDLRDYKGYDWDFKALAKELYRVTKDGGVVVWVVGDKTVNGSETLSSFKQAIYFNEVGFNVHDTMIYRKDGSPFPDFNRYQNCFEYMFVFSKGKPNTINLIKDKINRQYGNKVTGSERKKDGSLNKKRSCLGQNIKQKGIRENIWNISNGYMKTTKDKFAYEHPAMFPEQLAKDHILSWSDECDIVLDPFCGSGTTLKQAEILNRKWIGIDISQEYVNLSYKRVGKVNKKYYNYLPEKEKPAQLQMF
jgi:site-specific DNA-methyltransferase (adenine-specific)